MEPIQLAITAGVVGLIVIQGAFLVSLGLALGTWMERSDHALTVMMALVIFVMLGVPFLSIAAAFLLILVFILVCVGLAFIAERRRRPGLAKALAITALGLVGGLILISLGHDFVSSLVPDRVGRDIRQDLVKMGSPIVNIALPLIDSFGSPHSTSPTPEVYLILVGLWSILYALAAWLLYEATVWTFDRRLGRLPARRANTGGPRPTGNNQPIHLDANRITNQ